MMIINFGFGLYILIDSLASLLKKDPRPEVAQFKKDVDIALYNHIMTDLKSIEGSLTVIQARQTRSRAMINQLKVAKEMSEFEYRSKLKMKESDFLVDELDFKANEQIKDHIKSELDQLLDRQIEIDIALESRELIN